MSSRSGSFDNSYEQDKSDNEEFSTKEEEYNLDLVFKLVGSVSEILREIISNKENNNNKNKERLSAFASMKPPNISIKDYFERIVRYTKIEVSTLISCLIYMDRICDLNNVQITTYNVHKLILGTLILAIKFNEDDYYSNEFYSKVGGVSNSEFNKLESEAYSLLNHILWINQELYKKYENYLSQYKIDHITKDCLDD